MLSRAVRIHSGESRQVLPREMSFSAGREMLELRVMEALVGARCEDSRVCSRVESVSHLSTDSRLVPIK